MATALKRLPVFSRLALSRPSCRARRRFAPATFPQQRDPFSTSTLLCTQNRPDDGETIAGFPAAGGTDTTGRLNEEDPEEGEFEEEEMENDRPEANLGSVIGSDDLPEGIFSDEIPRDGSSTVSEMFEGIDDMQEEEDAEFELGADERDEVEEPRWPKSFWSIDEEREDPGEDPDFEGDDITSQAHGELEQHRELREFARVMAWDMPLLFNQAREFIPATAAQPLRFRYTTYMGEHHPAARKVVVTFTPSALDTSFSTTQTAKLIKLLGVRYNPSTDIAKMSCELYPTTAQNKRYLGDLVDKLLHEVKTGKDDFADVPFDFRHHKPKPKYIFPEEWKMTPERRAELDARREQKRIAEEGAIERGQLVIGSKIIGEAMNRRVASEKEAVMQVAAGAAAGDRNKAMKKRATQQM